MICLVYPRIQRNDMQQLCAKLPNITQYARWSTDCHVHLCGHRLVLLYVGCFRSDN